MTFTEVLNHYSWEELQSKVARMTAHDVRRALSRAGRCTISDFMALLSPAAAPFLEEMAQLSQKLTLKRFGKTVQLYIPLYLSNECHNVCTYCGFSAGNKIARKTLSSDEILQEGEAIRAMGFDHILLLTGEAHKTVGVDYIEQAVDLLSPLFANIGLEVQPLEQQDYQRLIAKGVHTVCVYQETYNRKRYAEVHPRGRKSKFDYRLETADRLGRAGVFKIGLGALIGLDDWRVDACCVGLHLAYLRKKYWQTRYSISFPRLRPAAGIEPPRIEMSEKELVQLICAYRLFDENVELTLSTRERALFRDNAVQLGITSMSAGSSTEPGGYAVQGGALQQFSISDERGPAEIAAMLVRQGFDPVWKDWDACLMSSGGAG